MDDKDKTKVNLIWGGTKRKKRKKSHDNTKTHLKLGHQERKRGGGGGYAERRYCSVRDIYPGKVLRNAEAV